jgi:hypothetical protein
MLWAGGQRRSASSLTLDASWTASSQRSERAGWPVARPGLWCGDTLQREITAAAVLDTVWKHVEWVGMLPVGLVLFHYCRSCLCCSAELHTGPMLYFHPAGGP